MFALENIIAALVSNITILNLLLIFGAVLYGMIIGAIPGLTNAVGLAVLLPFTHLMTPEQALIILGAAYLAGEYGGSISAILIKTPGTGAAVCTVFDGFPLTQQGKAQEALTVSLFSSFYGAIFGIFVLIFFAPPLASFALKFGPAETFWLAILGLACIAGLATNDVVKGVIAGCFGILLSMVGSDPLSGYSRFTFGFNFLSGGIFIIPAMIGFFAIPQMFVFLEKSGLPAGTFVKKKGVIKSVLKALMRMKLLLLKSSIIGAVVGAIPGAGGYVASFVSYMEAKRSSDDPKKFGTGCYEGVAAAESANNSMAGGSMIPLLTLGIPGSNATIMLLGAILIKGLVPGPALFVGQSVLIWSLIVGLIIASFFMLIQGLAGIKLWPYILRVKNNYLMGTIFILCVVGSYSLRGTMLDVYTLLVCGILGYIMLKIKFPVAPIILGLFLGSLAEKGLRQSMSLAVTKDSLFEYMVFKPISIILIIFIFFVIIFPIIQEYRSKKRIMKTSKVLRQEIIKTNKPSDILIGLVCIIMSTILYFEMQGFMGDYAKEFPRVILIIIIILSALMILLNLTSKKWAPHGERWGLLNTIPWRRLIPIGGGLILFIFGFPIVGFFLSSFIFLIWCTIIASNEKIDIKLYAKSSVFSTIVIFLIFFVFNNILRIRFPEGIFF